MVLLLADAMEALTGSRPSQAEIVITEAAIDSRQVIPGSMFVALGGERTDGHQYISAAFQRGANFALVQKDVPGDLRFLDLTAGTLPTEAKIPATPFCIKVPDTLKALQQIARFWRRKLNLRVIGITGSVGKSTTKELIAEVLSQRFHTLKNPGNLNNEIGLPLTLLRLSRGYERAVLEMGFYVPGEIRFLCDMALPQVGVITNIGTVHAERAGSQEAIAQGKAELVESLPPAPEGYAILNIDDPFVRAMAKKTKAQVFFYGLDSQADLWADDIVSSGLEGIHFRIHYRGDIVYFHVPLIGRHSVHTALRAAAVGLVEGLTWQDIAAGLMMGQSQLRLVAVHTDSGALILDDSYNASPESTLAALNLLDELDGRKVAVLGDMLELGPYEAQGHQIVGARAAEVAAELVLLGDRTQMVARAAEQARMDPKRIHRFTTLEEVTEYLRQSLGKGDIALIKGSHGMNMERIVASLESVSMDGNL